MRGASAKPKAGFRFQTQKWHVMESGGVCLGKKPHLYTKSDSCQGGRKSVYLQLPLTLGRKGAIGDGIPDVLQCLTYSTSSLSVV